MPVGMLVVIGDKDGRVVQELDAQGNLSMYMVSGDVHTFEKGDVVLHRYGTAIDNYLDIVDAAVPAISGGADVSRYGKVGIACVTSGDFTGELVPLYSHPTLGVYVSGDAIDVKGNSAHTIDTLGCPDLYMLCRGFTAGSMGIKVYLQGYNGV